VFAWLQDVFARVDQALLGVVVGALLTFLLGWFRDWRIECQQARSVRVMLSRDVEGNLAALRVFWGDASGAGDEEGDPDWACVLRARRLTELPMPAWGRRAWESPVPLLTRSLRAAEIRQVGAVYDGLDAVLAIRSTLSALKDDQAEESRAYRSSSGPQSIVGPPRPFDRSASALWGKFEQIVRGLLDSGNPLQGRMRFWGRFRRRRSGG
jgi:hypothetical protein